ncbi:hypothetical protein RQP46_006380 [Phenoliferia psychrophenolica]
MAARKSAPNGVQVGPARDFRFTRSALQVLADTVDDLQASLSPRSDSPGSSPFLPSLQPWLDWDGVSQEWEVAEIERSQWKGFAEAVSILFNQFRDPAHSRQLALAGPYGIKLVLLILHSFGHWGHVPRPAEETFQFICDEIGEAIRTQIAHQTRVKGSFHSVLPTEILKIVIGMAHEFNPSKVDLALVHPVWRDIALPLIWSSVAVVLDHDAEVQFFARVARGTSYHTQSLCNIVERGFPEPLICVDRAVLAVKGLRELSLTKVAASMSIFQHSSMKELKNLSLRSVILSDPLTTTPTFPFNLQSLTIYNGTFREDFLDAFLTAITPGSSSTLQRLSLDSPKAVQNHLPSFSRNLVELSLTRVEGGAGYFTGLNFATLDLSALRKLTLPCSELVTLLAEPPADTPPDAPRSTVAETIPQLEHLTILCYGSDVEYEDFENLERLLGLPLCTALRALTLEDAEFDEEMGPEGMEVFRKTVVVCRGRGVVVTVNEERLC